MSIPDTLLPRSLVVLLLVVASTAVLYVRLRQAAAEALVGRALDKAAALALAARSMPLDDGVAARLAGELAGAAVLQAALVDGDGNALAGGELRDVPRDHARDWAGKALRSTTWQTYTEEGLLGANRLELWYPVELRPQAREPQLLRPGPPDTGRRVLLLVLDTQAQRDSLRPALSHAVLITALLVVLLALTRRQIRADQAERRRAEARASELRLLELGRLSGVLAHEIRNPLGAIKGFAQLTARRFAPSDPAHDDMQVVVSEAARLERLVETLLTYARPLELQKQTIDLREVLQQVARLAEGGEVPVQVQEGASVTIEGDRDQLCQALLNLVRNAQQASPPDTPVQLGLEVTAGQVELFVDDRGPGIASELQQTVFEPYYTTKATGTGIGLAVTRRIAEAHGGQVSIRNRDGGGARVAIRLPTARTT
ncbi:MAG: HAMP domain-containing histidine kinase [Deltaproteobacteria bacterium]|nr:HAMP domain-containing histidine kinase [Deltaproteobacteria bacterium]